MSTKYLVDAFVGLARHGVGKVVEMKSGLLRPWGSFIKWTVEIALSLANPMKQKTKLQSLDLHKYVSYIKKQEFG